MNALRVAQIPQHGQQVVDGLCRVCRSVTKISRDNCEYRVFTLTDVTGEIIGIVWPEKYRGQYYPRDNEIVQVKGKVRIYSNGFTAVDIYEIRPVPRTAANPIELFPRGPEINMDDVSELIQIIDEINSPSLKYFLFQVFGDDALTQAFLTGKASAAHHHAGKGGLLRHSLECARIVSRFTEISREEREIGIVSALLHDIAKTLEHYNIKRFTAPMVCHDTRTLELLAAPLRTLEQHWSDGANLIRMALEYPLTRKEYLYRKIHIPMVAELVWFADQASTGLDMEKSAFSDAPAWKSINKQKNVTYWRPAADNYTWEEDMCA